MRRLQTSSVILISCDKELFFSDKSYSSTQLRLQFSGESCAASVLGERDEGRSDLHGARQEENSSCN